MKEENIQSQNCFPQKRNPKTWGRNGKEIKKKKIKKNAWSERWKNSLFGFIISEIILGLIKEKSKKYMKIGKKHGNICTKKNHHNAGNGINNRA